MKLISKLLFFSFVSMLSSCIPVHRHVIWETDQTTITNEKGTEIIGAPNGKKKSDDREDDEGPKDSLSDARAISLIPLANEIYDFSR